MALKVGFIRRYLKKLRGKNSRVLTTEVPSPFHYAIDIQAVHEYFSSFTNELEKIPNPPHTLEGRCYLCKVKVVFKIDIPADGTAVNWRETLVCPICHLINRWRSCLHVFDAICKPAIDDHIYLTETLSPVYQNLADRYPQLVSSEYFPGAEFGEMVQTHAMQVRNEDVTRLTFADVSLKHILCFDVLEHVPDYRLALTEFYRVLKVGGFLVLSVPFSFQHKTNVRARLDERGDIEHLVEPCYHGDPLSETGVLSYYDFGMELLDELRGAGFEECALLCYYSKHWGYLNENVVFVARRLQ